MLCRCGFDEFPKWWDLNSQGSPVILPKSIQYSMAKPWKGSIVVLATQSVCFLPKGIAMSAEFKCDPSLIDMFGAAPWFDSYIVLKVKYEGKDITVLLHSLGH